MLEDERRSVSFRLLGARENDRESFLSFARGLPRNDLLYLPWDITDAAVIEEWLEDIRRHRVVTVLAADGLTIVGEASLIFGRAQWTSHIGEVRVNVALRFRGLGLGWALVDELFEIAHALGTPKLSAQMTHDQIGAQVLFNRIGFKELAVLPAYVRTRDGTPRDLVVMLAEVGPTGD